jgi:hypothetical protein
MSNDWLYPILTHRHKPADGNSAEISYNDIADKPEPGVIERTDSYECLGSNLLSIKGATTPPKYLVLPGVSRYNKEYGQTSLTLDGAPLIRGVDWEETDRPATSRRDDTTAYWTHLITVFAPVSSGKYRLTWKERIVTDYVRGIREARISDTGGVLWDGHVTMPVQPDGVEKFPNGVAWDPLPAGYKIEIWRKTKHKQSGMPSDDVLHRRSGVRWMVWRTVDATELTANLDQLTRYPAPGAARDVKTMAFKLAYLRPDGARSLLSQEVAVLHGIKPWGPANTIHEGRVRVK